MEADWLTENSKTLCQLLQNIDHFAVAGFRHYAGEPLQFFLQESVYPSEIRKASLFVEPAPWRDTLTYQQDYPVFLESRDARPGGRLAVYGDVAELMLDSLVHGHYPVFSYERQNKETRVAISAINFSEPYREFADCRRSILPFGKKQLEQESLIFAMQSKSLTSASMSRLRQFADYMKEMKKFRAVVVSDTAITGKADEKWFVERAKHIISQLGKLGVAASRLSIKTGVYSGGGRNELALHVFGPDSLRFIYYRKGNTALNAREKQRLDLLVRYIHETSFTGQVIIGSHTDSKGSRSGNLDISRRRGEVVKNYLETQGLDPNRISVKAYGETRPAKSNRFPTGRAQNRRVVISLVN